MKIGITERGDIAFDNQWMNKFHKMDFCILISKGLPNEDIQEFMIDSSNKIIFHATTTGYGGTILEPNVVDFKTRIDNLCQFCNNGFPKSHVVIRVDPIIPSEKGIELAKEVIEYSIVNGFCRFRYSFIDMYSHVKNRFVKAGLPIPTTGSPNAAVKMICDLEIKYKPIELLFESCAENTVHQTGCISKRDLDIVDIIQLPDEDLSGSSNQRKGCLCPACKTELLDRKHPCPHHCLYCYWKD